MPVFSSLTDAMWTAQDICGAVQNQTHSTSLDSGGFFAFEAIQNDQMLPVQVQKGSNMELKRQSEV